MLFGIIGGIIFFAIIGIDEKVTKKRETRKAQEGGYEVYFSF